MGLKSNNSIARPRGVSILAILLILISVFALASSLYLWGAGFLFDFPEGADYIFPVADLLVTVPAGLIAAIGLWRMAWWGYAASLMVAGIYIYSSVGVYVMVAQQGPPYALELVLPPIAGLVMAAGMIIYLWRIKDLLQ